MPFQPGQSGNPAGKPKGTRNKTTVALEALLDGEAEEITRKIIEMAKAGDSTALRLCIERVMPPRKDRPVSFDMPALETAADAVKASQSIVVAVADGDLTPGEAHELSKVVESFARTVEVADLAVRIERLEQQLTER